MAKQRWINTRFWREDGYTADLDANEKLLFVYLLTNPETTLSGVYEQPLKNMVSDTGINRDTVIAILDKFSADKKIFRHENWVCLVNHPKHLKRLSENHRVGIIHELETVPAAIVSQLPDSYIKGIHRLGIATEYITSSSSFTFTSTFTTTAGAVGKNKNAKNSRDRTNL